MTPLKIDSDNGLNLLCLGAHCDDIEIGCGGAILKLIENYPIQKLIWVVFASNEIRRQEATASANAFLEKINHKEIEILHYRDAFLQDSFTQIKEYFESIKKATHPDLIFTHFRDDLHQDHRLISNLTWNTFRNHMILEYEIPKYDGDLGKPNCFFQLTEEQALQKVDTLLQHYISQKEKHWFDAETFLSLMRIRGLESACDSRYAEAFHVRKWVL